MKKLCLTTLLAATSLLSRAQQDATALPDPKPVVLVPDDRAFIRDYMSRYRHGMVNMQKDKVILMRYIEQTLVRNGIPRELKNLAVVESYLERQTISSAGAAGPWQLMQGTAVKSGLVVNDSLDERFDIYKSTRVAVSLLKFLHHKYKDWHLAVAAYNAGTGRVDQAIKQAGSNLYWDVEGHLPAETRAHVKKFMASSFVLDGKIPETNRYIPGTTVKDTLSSRGLATEPVNAGIRLDVVAQALGIPEADVQQWNPGFATALQQNGRTDLVLPADKMPDFRYKKSEILKASIARNIETQSTSVNED